MEDEFLEKCFQEFKSTLASDIKETRIEDQILEQFTINIQKIATHRKDLEFLKNFKNEESMKSVKNTTEVIHEDKPIVKPSEFQVSKTKWLQDNKAVFEKQALLKTYEEYIQKQEEQLLKEIIAHSNPSVAKKVFQNVSE
jgi:hypothetical protein